MAHDVLDFLFHHVFLPPQLPQSSDFDSGHEAQLYKAMLEALETFENLVSDDDKTAVIHLKEMVHRTLNSHDHSAHHILENEVKCTLQDLSRRPGFVALQVFAQNAGIVVNSLETGHLSFECFEISPLNKATMTVDGRLRRTFPGYALSITPDVASNSDFTTSIAHTVAMMSHQAVAGQQPQVRKAFASQDEDRDTTHPGVVTEYLTGLLTGIGRVEKVQLLSKACRDEVLWRDARSPWRRSPTWMLLRVSLQLVLLRLQKHYKLSGSLYKCLMVLFMSQILAKSTDQGLPSDVLHTMQTKVFHRLCKLHKHEVPVSTKLMDCVSETVRASHARISIRWKVIQDRHRWPLNLYELRSLRFEQDTPVALPDLDEFVDNIAHRKSQLCRQGHAPRDDLIIYETGELPYLNHPTPNEPLKLHAFEEWVAHSLQLWINTQHDFPNACLQLARLLKDYHAIAKTQYDGDPEGTSIMLLTLLELWATCDRLAIAICPLVKDYAPDIPCEPLQGLLLPFAKQTDRLNRVEEHLIDRANARYPSENIFQTMNLNIGFAPRFFDQSSACQTTRTLIEAAAAEQKAAKVAELNQKKVEYVKWQDLYNRSSCEYEERQKKERGVWKTHKRHKPNCKHCSYATEMENMQIDVHEWPLPNNGAAAKTIVFELLLPPWFASWRNITAYLRLDVLAYEYREPSGSLQTKKPLSEDQQLSGYIRHSAGRISLLSDKKANIGTHRVGKAIATTTAADVCLRNGLNYRYYDFSKDTLVTDGSPTDKIARACTYSLPSRSKALQQFLFRPARSAGGPTPNTVISDQSNCPAHLTLHEFKELASMPLGYNLQWWNLSVQLGAPSIDFKKHETALTFMQCMYQAGPLERSSRPAHLLPCDDAFASRLTDHLEQAFTRITENWESLNALAIFVKIATRLYDLNQSIAVRCRLLDFLRKARRLSMRWVTVLKGKIAAADSNDRDALHIRCTEVALVAASTFHIYRDHLLIWLRDREAASTLVFIAIVIHEGKACAVQDGCFPFSRRRHFRTLQDAMNTLAGSSSHSALDDALRKAWSGFIPSTGWSVCETSRHCVTTIAEPRSVVHIDLLTGELLVDGLPLNRLPGKYESHPDYKTLFEDITMEVVPTKAHGLDYSSTYKHHGNQLEFGMNERDLLIRSIDHKDLTTYELVPRRVFRGRFPDSFVNDFTHWYRIETGRVEFRPVEQSWAKVSPQRCILTRDSNNRWTLELPTGGTVIGIDSATAETVSGKLAPLTQPLQVHTVFHHPSEIVINIPRLRLGFRLKQAESSLLSNEFGGYALDEDQSLDTLVGLENKIMLKHIRTQERIVLVLQGDVSFTKGMHEQHGMSVTVDVTKAAKVLPYHVDPHLGRLIDNGNLQSKLYIAYLHALTSFCLPDPLTRLTGSEQALIILNSAAVRSFDSLTVDNTSTLCNIANITPRRFYYPPSDRVMQTVHWSQQLSFLSQLPDYYDCVQALFAQSRKWNSMYPSECSLPVLRSMDSTLLSREMIRACRLRVSDFGAADFRSSQDSTYSARDCGQNSTIFRNAYIISSNIQQQRSNNWSEPLTRAHLWSFLSGSSVIKHTFHSGLDVSNIKYSGSLFQTLGESIACDWLLLLHFLAGYTEQRRPCQFSLMTWLSAVACSEIGLPICEALATFYKHPQHFQTLNPSYLSNYLIRDGIDVTSRDLILVASQHNKDDLELQEKVSSLLERHRNESTQAYEDRCEQFYKASTDRANSDFAAVLIRLWPSMTITDPDFPATVATYIHLDKAMQSARSMFRERSHNLDLYGYLESVTQGLSLSQAKIFEIPSPAWLKPKVYCRVEGHVTCASLFADPAPEIVEISPLLAGSVSTVPVCGDASRVEDLITSLEEKFGQTEFEKRYLQNLAKSVVALKGITVHRPSIPSLAELQVYYKDCVHRLDQINSVLYETQPEPQGSEPQNLFALGRQVQVWPRVRPCFFLMQLHRRRWVKLSESWRACIIEYATTHAALQRAKRLIKAAGGDQGDLVAELRNVPHKTWNPYTHPEWLLLEVESNITIRSVQAEIAKEMISPKDAHNASMQLNMGEGKSSVIVPIAVASLTDGSRLVRAIVAKPQSKQMAQMMVAKLGGMLGRQVHYMPFSRSIKLDDAGADMIRNACEECMMNGGLLLVQPEHILSFQLMSLEAYISGKPSLGSALLKTQHLFDSCARDIIDESDENFSVKYELIYTMGAQRPTEMSPERWLYIQEILDMVRDVAIDLAIEQPKWFEIQDVLPHAFPRIRILDQQAETILTDRLVHRVCDMGLVGLAIGRQSDDIRQAVHEYISDLNAGDEVRRTVLLKFASEQQKNTLLLLRGLLAGGIIAFVLGRKRWRVNYGLDSTRIPKTRLAVPYRAKDMPSARSEFSHPEVVILLTCLSYYYSGLEDEVIMSTFEHLIETDQKEIEYQDWIKGIPNLDIPFRQIDGINLRDRAHCVSRVFPAVRSSKAMIDYFLRHFVFPKEMKEFPHKLSASGWDLGKAKRLPTSAFSGTSDSQVLLPLDVKHLDLPEQEHTNALVLAYLLQPENSVVLQQPSSNSSTAENLIHLVIDQSPSPRVILDVGAQILELSNLELAQKWLACTNDDKVRAAVYVNDKDVVSVIDRNGFDEPLQTSPFADQLGSCIVFLDDAHTRGIDLRLPRDYRAAVTLGSNLTKDRLVQACMRMRKLGHGQSVVFCITPEIHGKIMQCTGKSQDTGIDVSDVLQWSIWETCVDIQRNSPLWAMQGRRFARQEVLWNDTMTSDRATRFLEDEAQSLTKRYGPISAEDHTTEEDADPNSKLAQIQQRQQGFGAGKSLESTLQEEQERELAPEIEQERQVERAKPARPAAHALHQDVVDFVKYGIIKPQSPAYTAAFEVFKNTSASRLIDTSQLSGSGLWATRDFARTVILTLWTDATSYQRAVQWILTTTSPSDDRTIVHAMVISPYEAQQLFPMLSRSRSESDPIRATLHRYKPNWNMEQLRFDDFQNFTVPHREHSFVVPSSLATQIRLFAGSLYFSSVKEYDDLCQHLGVAKGLTKHETTADGFIVDQADRSGAWPNLRDNPLPFINALLRIRRDNADFGKTHMGRLVAGDMRLPRIIEQDLGEDAEVGNGDVEMEDEDGEKGNEDGEVEDEDHEKDDEDVEMTDVE